MTHIKGFEQKQRVLPENEKNEKNGDGREARKCPEIQKNFTATNCRDAEDGMVIPTDPTD
jgi:predicted nucleic acid-binding protein